MKEKKLTEWDKQLEKESKELKNMAGISTSRMLEPDPLEGILRDARKRCEKRVTKALKENNTNDIIQYFRTYRTLTKLINREPLSIFDI